MSLSLSTAIAKLRTELQTANFERTPGAPALVVEEIELTLQLEVSSVGEWSVSLAPEAAGLSLGDATKQQGTTRTHSHQVVLKLKPEKLLAVSAGSPTQPLKKKR